MGSSKLMERIKIYLDDADGVEEPLKFRHMKHVRMLMTEVTVWPYRAFDEKRAHAVQNRFNIALILVGSLLPFPKVLYLYVFADIMDVGAKANEVIVLFLNCLFLQRLWFSRSDKFASLTREFVDNFHLVHFKNRSEYANKIFHRVHMICGAFSIYILYMLHFGVASYNVIPLYANFKMGMFSSNPPENATYLHSAYYYFPNNFLCTTRLGYTLLAIYNWVMALMIAGMFVNFDLLLYIIVLQIWGHLKILKQSLYSMPPPSNKDGAKKGMYSAEENVRIQSLLRDCVMHHQLIIEFVDRCSFVFGEYLFMFYAIVQVISCVLLLEMSAMTADVITKFAPLFSANFISLIQCSVLFELLNTKSTELIDAVYHLPWESMDKNNRRTVVIFLHRSQTPLSIKAGKIVPVGVQTMLTVFKTSLSYFMLLQTMTTQE